MKRALNLAAALTLALAGAAQARQPFFWGAGGQPCHDWTQARHSQDHEAAAMRGWVLGMVSAYNIRRDASEAGVTPGGDVLDNASPEELLGGVNNYSGDHPGEPIWKAVYFVLQEFDERNAALAPPAPAPSPDPTPPASDAPVPAPSA